jgi:uncharacterized protein
VTICPENAAQAARHVKGATIAWGGDRYLDLLNPNPEVVTIEDYAYALAFSVRWRGQTQIFGRRVLYGVAEHCVRGAEQMLREGYGREAALAFLGHESDEVPFGDTPGPAKQLWSPEQRVAVRRWGDALDLRFGFGDTHSALVKRFDIRMLVTEKRDLLAGHQDDVFSTDGEHMADGRYSAFEQPIKPYRHPERAAERFLNLYRQLGGIS